MNVKEERKRRAVHPAEPRKEKLNAKHKSKREVAEELKEGQAALNSGAISIVFCFSINVREPNRNE